MHLMSMHFCSHIRCFRRPISRKQGRVGIRYFSISYVGHTCTYTLAYKNKITFRLGLLRAFIFKGLISAELSLWLGGTDILQEHNFLWATSGTRITYDRFNDWHPRQPDNKEDSEHCLMMDQHSGWHDAACSEHKRFVCEKDNK